MPGPNTGYPFSNDLSLPASAINSALLNAYTEFHGSPPPADPQPGWKWWNSSQTPVLRQIWDGTQWVSAEQLDTSAHIYIPAPPRKQTVTNGAVAMLASAGIVLLKPTNTITLTLAGVGPVTIKDLLGACGTYACTIVPNVGTIDGLTEIAITENYGSVNLVGDGTTWGRY